MFTVIIAQQEILDLFKETEMFYGDLYDAQSIVFCPWNPKGETLDEMLPSLYDVLEYRAEWRALVLYNGDIHQINPFDFTHYCESRDIPDEDWARHTERLRERCACYEKAIQNPLALLSMALCGISVAHSVIEDEEVYQSLLRGDTPLYEYMLSLQLDALDSRELSANMEKLRYDELLRFVAEDSREQLLIAVRDRDVCAILNLVATDDILAFIRFIGNADPLYSDPEYVRCLIENTYKQALIETVSHRFAMKDRRPAEVICLSERTFNFDEHDQQVNWLDIDETRYSRFADFNLYSPRLRFVLYDMIEQDHNSYAFDQVRYICLALMLSRYEIPSGALNPSRVYRARIDVNDAAVAAKCEKYVGKLKATQRLLLDIDRELKREDEETIDDRTVERLFESNISIPVTVKEERRQTELYSRYRSIGLAVDCPTEEEPFWSRQYHTISKAFIKYLREPRRAVRTAVTDNFRSSNVIEDDRVLLMDEDQREDVLFRLQEEEQRMVETTTAHIFDTQRYQEKIDEADRKIRKGIAQRMTKKQILITGVVAMLAYLIGFMPMIIGGLKTVKTSLFSAVLVGVAVFVFMLIGFIFLFVLRRRLVAQFKNFNRVIGSICEDIRQGLSRFSLYFSSACNVMREFSVLNVTESSTTKKRKIVAFHRAQIDRKICEVFEVFAQYVDIRHVDASDDVVYDYDYTIMTAYEYPMPDQENGKTIDFLQNGHRVTVPVDYIDGVTMIREEFYD